MPLPLQPRSPSLTRRQTLTRLLALGASGTAAAAACGGAGGGAGVTLRFWSWTPIDPAVDLWNRTHRDVRVEISSPAGGESIFQRLSAAMVAGSGAPDLVQVDYNNLTTLAVAGYLEDITGHVGGLRDRFLDTAWRQVLIDDRVWAVPQDLGPMAMFYREDIFDAHGLAVPRTWPEFRETAGRLRDADPDRYLTAFPEGDAYWFASLAAAGGGRWFATEGDAWRVSIDDAPSRATADYWTGLLADGLVTTRQHWNPAWHRSLQDGTLATWFGPAWGTATFDSHPPEGPGARWQVAPLPSAEADRPSSGFWGGSSTAVVAGSEHAEAAVEFATWLNTDPGAADIVIDPAVAGLFPASLAGQRRPALARPHEALGGQSVDGVFRDAAEHARPMTWGPTMDRVSDDLMDAFASALNGGRPLATALESTQRDAVAALRQKGLGVRA
ncbi:extracellular solute-binding protein [Streptomyces sp. SBT349]|uniref:extracellular solute-binding protein n=1 Tax=Streptomyces sp. SBT349 TaxID=1580539 RepID=UPI00066B8531|nr:extracellular solute-binding protein [Streptomyces sp. SBT349]